MIILVKRAWVISLVLRINSLNKKKSAQHIKYSYLSVIIFCFAIVIVQKLNVFVIYIFAYKTTTLENTAM